MMPILHPTGGSSSWGRKNDPRPEDRVFVARFHVVSWSSRRRCDLALSQTADSRPPCQLSEPSPVKRGSGLDRRKEMRRHARYRFRKRLGNTAAHR